MRKSAVKAYDYFVSNKGKRVLPSDLNAHLGVGNYNSRTVWILKNRLGCKIDTIKQGRTIVAYVLTDYPETRPAILEGKSKVKKTSKPVVVKTKKVATAKSGGPKTVKKEVKTIVKSEDNVDQEAFAIDPDFDSVEVGDVEALVA